MNGGKGVSLIEVVFSKEVVVVDASWSDEVRTIVLELWADKGVVAVCIRGVSPAVKCEEDGVRD